MTRSYSRVSLEVTGVRVERLQDITDAEAFEEGVEEVYSVCMTCLGSGTHPYGDVCGCDGGGNVIRTEREEYRRLWDLAHYQPGYGAGAKNPLLWGANPYVWVVEFRRVEGA